MVTSETPKKRKTKIRIKRRNNNNYNYNNDTTSAAQLEIEEKLLEIVRSKLIQIIAAGIDGKNRSPEQQMEAVDAGV